MTTPPADIVQPYRVQKVSSVLYRVVDLHGQALAEYHSEGQADAQAATLNAVHAIGAASVTTANRDVDDTVAASALVASDALARAASAAAEIKRLRGKVEALRADRRVLAEEVEWSRLLKTPEHLTHGPLMYPGSESNPAKCPHVGCNLIAARAATDASGAMGRGQA